MINDPIVEEIREIRRRLWEECGGDLDRYLARLKTAEAGRQDRLVTKEQLENRSETLPQSPARTADSNS